MEYYSDTCLNDFNDLQFLFFTVALVAFSSFTSAEPEPEPATEILSSQEDLRGMPEILNFTIG